MKKKLVALTFAVLCSMVRAEEPNVQARAVGLGQPARFEGLEDGKKVVYTAEIVQLQRFGQYSWSKEKLASPRPVYQTRTTRQREGQEVEQIGPAFFSEEKLHPDSAPPECKDIAWTPSILVENGVAWVLFTRHTYERFGPRFNLYFFNANQAGRPPDKENIIGENAIGNEKQHRPPDFSNYVGPFLTVELQDWLERECFDRYQGAFKLKRIENGELILTAPVLIESFCPEVRKMDEFGNDIDYRNEKASHEKNPEASPAPVHYKDLMKDKELVLRYHIEKKQWKLDIPEGYKRKGAL